MSDGWSWVNRKIRVKTMMLSFLVVEGSDFYRFRISTDVE